MNTYTANIFVYIIRNITRMAQKKRTAYSILATSALWIYSTQKCLLSLSLLVYDSLKPSSRGTLLNKSFKDGSYKDIKENYYNYELES